MALMAGVGAAVLLAACASSGDVEKVEQTNRVQDERLQALEISMGKEVDNLTKKAQELTRALKAAEGRLLTGNERQEKILRENEELTTALEKANAQFLAMKRRFDKEEELRGTQVAKQERDLDALRLKLDDVEKLMKSPIAELPEKTAADKLFREAFALMISGQMDLAADKFETFRKTHRSDPRAPEALYRRGQAFFLMRRYDRAIVPFFELVDKFPKDKLVVDARWMLARGLEETGDLKLAREFYAQLIAEDTIHKADATRRVHFINRIFPTSGAQGAGPEKSAAKN